MLVSQKVSQTRSADIVRAPRIRRAAESIARVAYSVTARWSSERIQPSIGSKLCMPPKPLREIVAKGAMLPLVLVVDDCRAAYDRMRAHGVEFAQESVDRYVSVNAGFRDPSGNG
jgi:hypothetical protein